MVELPQRRILVASSAVVALLFLPLPFWTVHRITDGGSAWDIGTGVAGSIVLCLVPLWAAVTFYRQHVLVGPDSVQVRYGDRIARELRFADLTEVRVTVDGSVGGLDGRSFHQAVLLIGTDPGGRRRGIKVTRNQVETIDPLLRALATEVARRPELFTRDLYRRLYEEYVAAMPPE